MAKAKKGGLGRGLEALFADQVPVVQETETTEKATRSAKSGKSAAQTPQAEPKDGITYVSIHNIKPNPNQPRKTFDKEKISELAESIKENGIIQPLIVSKTGKTYEIISGERRFRAAMEAGLKEVPCISRKLTDQQRDLFAIVENMQREDLNPMEEAAGLERMISEYGLTQDEVARSVGKSRPYVANSLRLLKLPEYIRDYVASGALTPGHARALINMKDPKARHDLAEQAKNGGLTVRETEKLAGQVKKGRKPVTREPKDPNLAKVEDELKEILGTKVTVKTGKRKGRIEIEFFSEEERERLIEILFGLRN
ncbi:MAG: ParB/RepB/Spo0J family partition protein [Clostridia bacterium]|nr:ParB/RepB/Spo0J family partition protein [Clostridia bacterium]